MAAASSRRNRLVFASPFVCTCESECASLIAYLCRSVCASLALRVQTFITDQNNSFVSLPWQRTPMTWLAAAATRDVRVIAVSKRLNCATLQPACGRIRPPVQQSRDVQNISA